MSVLTKTVKTETKEPLPSVAELLELLENISSHMNEASSLLGDVEGYVEDVVEEVKGIDGENKSYEVEQLLYENVILQADSISIDNEIGEVNDIVNSLHNDMEVGDE
tara:strand:- start:2685 stop:3005 length:321 start_codon:yes stop_codon:yes gene_type:complete